MLGLFPRLSSPPAADHWQGGNKYRKMLIYGAWAVLPYIAERDTPFGR
jgi:hypothetical protein